MKKIAISLLILLVGYGLFTLSIWQLNDGFSLSHIEGELPRMEGGDLLKEKLPQNFYYLGKGSQCYVFESEDHDLVLKFFRFPRYQLHPLTRYFAHPAFLAEIYDQKRAVKQKKLEALLQSCLIAAHKLPEECGLLSLHLNKSDHLRQTITLHDRLKRPYPLNLDDYVFILQKKGEPTLPYLSRLLDQGCKEEARAALANLAHLLNSRIKKGIYDNDAVIHKNSGFLDGKAFFLDLGGFSFGTTQQEEVVAMTKELKGWLEERDLSLAIELDALLDREAAIGLFDEAISLGK